ncbi:MAG: fused MFS/spermidine synthase [Actinobacteria bacterium]|nr:fused MFS/spermidine synthase [Actinomycetota bacterium]
MLTVTEESDDGAPVAAAAAVAPVDRSMPPPDPVAARAGRGTVAVFTAATFVSASLLFLVQPLVAKMLLPLLGGSAAVWNTASVFFQAVLLAGYAFSHLSLRRLGVRRQPWLQAAVALVGLAVLPIAIPSGWVPPAGAPGLWTLLVLGATVGLPFFVLSTVSPTLQRWFAATDHPSAHDPYFLYAAGNVGSLLSLLAYPLVAEPLLSSGDLSHLWTIGYATFVVLLLACWAQVRRTARRQPTDAPEAERSPLSWATRLRWAGFAAVPSGLMLGVTRHISSDVAAMPLLWVVPLALYLGTFIVAFGRRPERAVAVASRALKLLVVPLTLSFFGFLSSIEVGLALHLSVFSAAAMVAHGRLSLDRPGTDRLTDFYLMLSVGGVVGGATAALLAPVLFSSVLEYPVFLVAALALLPRSAFGGAGPTAPDATTHGVGAMLARARGAISPRVLVVAAAVLGTAVASVAIRSSGTQEALVTAMLVAAVGAMAAFVLTRSAAGFATSIGVILALGLLVPANATRYQSRTFYGVHRVYEDQANGGRHVLLNGSTVHGMEDVTGPQAGQPTTYYHPTGPIGRWFALHRADPPRRIGVVGLGSGALAWYGRAGDRMRFYEIDDAVVHIAQDPDLFTFVDRSKADVDVEVGDGRLLLAEEAGPKADALVIDAFSGDSIPAHLLTDEAVGLYLRRLDEHGTLVVHISNRFFDFRPVVAKLAAAHDLAAYVAFDPATPEQAAQGKLASTWVVMARTAADAGVADQPGWTRMDGGGSVPLWTDDRSDLLRLLRR